MSDSLLTRREAIATLACTATLPLMSACNREPVTTASTTTSSTNTEAGARALLDDIGNSLLRLVPETATSLGIEKPRDIEIGPDVLDDHVRGDAPTPNGDVAVRHREALERCGVRTAHDL